MKLLQYHPVTINIDGEDVFFRIKRQTIEENAEFMNRLQDVGTPTAARFVSRASSGPEQEKDEEGNYKISLLELVQMKVHELPPKELQEYRKAQAEDEKTAQEFLKYAFGSFVTVEKDLIEVLEDGTEKSVTDGLDVLRLFGARQDVLGMILEAIRVENTHSAEQKKISRSVSVFSPTSTGQAPDQAGPKHETTATPVETAAIAESADV